MRPSRVQILTSFCTLSLVALAACDPKAGGLPIQDQVVAEQCGPDQGDLGEQAAQGIINGHKLSLESRIAKGLVYIRTQVKEGQAACTGVLIGPRLVLTAAHCVTDLENLNADQVAGYSRLDFTNNGSCAGHLESARSYKPSRIITHADYDPINKTNDLALMILARPAPSEQRPVPLPTVDELPAASVDVFVAGYGIQEDIQKKTNTSDRRLRYTKLHTDDDPVRKLGTRLFGNVPENDLLTLRSDQGSAACSGDSGGPAMISKDGHLVLIGIASFVFDVDQKVSTCNSRVGYTRVFKFKDWIRDSTAGLGPEVAP